VGGLCGGATHSRAGEAHVPHVTHSGGRHNMFLQDVPLSIMFKAFNVTSDTEICTLVSQTGLTAIDRCWQVSWGLLLC
jgi:DNA-directed RNA polymerase beta subunit